MRESYLKRWLRDTLGIFNLELRNILHDGGVMIIFIAAGFFYPILYNFVYKNGILEETPVAVVDNADCGDSRRMIREMDATRELDIAYECLSMEEAKELFRLRKVNGIIYFPSDFGERLAYDETAKFSIYADMSSFLYYKNLLMGSNFVMLHEVNNIKIERYSFDGLTDAQADQAVNTVLYEDINPYNRAFSYSIFLISAILMLIIQQVMFYGMSMSVGTMREENRGEPQFRFASGFAERARRGSRGARTGCCLLADIHDNRHLRDNHRPCHVRIPPEGRFPGYNGTAEPVCDGLRVLLHGMEHSGHSTRIGLHPFPVHVAGMRLPYRIQLAFFGIPRILEMVLLPVPFHLRVPGLHQPEYGRSQS